MGLTGGDVADGFRGLPRYLASHPVLLCVFSLAMAWALAVILAPMVVPHGTLAFGSDGAVGGDEHGDEISGIENPVARFVYLAGEASCHQLEERSFALNGNQMPFCARCASIFAGIPLGMLAFAAIRRPINPLWLVASIVPIGIDGLAQLLSSYESCNVLRVATGGLAGAAAGYALGFSIIEIVALVSSRGRPQP
jgi:uncharacterized membrane protein